MIKVVLTIIFCFMYLFSLWFLLIKCKGIENINNFIELIFQMLTFIFIILLSLVYGWEFFLGYLFAW